jgi:MFS family permease
MASSPRLLPALLQLMVDTPLPNSTTSSTNKNNRGIVNSFGVYQTYYESQLLSDPSSSDISWIGSLQAFLLLITGVITGPLYDAGYFRPLTYTGSFLVVFGMMMMSLCTEYWQVILAQGLCVGIGSGCLFIPSVAIVSTYFSTKKSLATGIAASGSSIAGVIYLIVFHRLQPVIGFPWATRVIAFIMLATLLIPLAVMRVRIQPAQKRPLFDKSALKEPPFMLFTLGAFFGFIGIYIPFFYMPTFAVQKIPGVTAEFAVYTIAIMNAASTLGRIVPNYIADKAGPLNIIAPCALISAVLVYCWIAVENKGGLIVLCILYGFFTGSFVSLPPSVIVTLSPRLEIVGTRMGMLFSLSGLGLLIGSPVAGAILGSGNNFLGLQLFCACTVLASAAVLYPARFAKAGRSLITWA